MAKKIRKPADRGQWVVAHMSVGKFLFHWAALESSLVDALQLGFGLNGLTATILAGNLQLRDKLNILKTLLHMYEHEDSTALIKVLDDVGTYSTTRNMVAHDFHAASGDDVRFYRIKAKGKFSIPETIWTDDDFQVAYDRIDALKDAMEAKMDAFTPPAIAPLEPKDPRATRQQAGQVPKRLRSPRTRSTRGSPSTTPKKSGEIPPPEKE